MVKEIGGIEFDATYEYCLNSLDGALSIYGIGTNEQNFSFTTRDIGRFKAVFSHFHCVAVSFSAVDDSDAKLDFELIGHPERIVRLGIDALYFPIELRFLPARTYFPNLREVQLLGALRGGFPDLRGNHLLEKLDVDIDRDLTPQWFRLAQLKNLVLHGYSENDLLPLRGLRSLVRLEIVGGLMQSLNGLELLPSLRTLLISGAPKLTDLEPLLRADGIENIAFSLYRKVTDWSFLAHKRNLRHVILSTVESLGFVRELPQLEYLHANKVLTRKERRVLYENRGLSGTAAAEGIITSWEADYSDFHGIDAAGRRVEASTSDESASPPPVEAVRGISFELPMAGDVVFADDDCGRWEFDIDSPFGPLMLTFVMEGQPEERQLSEPMLRPAVKMLRDLARLDQAARAGIRGEYATTPSTSEYFVTWHEQNYGPEALAELFDTDSASLGVDELLNAISLRAISFQLDDEEGFAVLDYRLRELETKQILVVHLSRSGEVEAVSLES